MNSELKMEQIIDLVKTVKPFDESDFDDGLNDLESAIMDDVDSAVYDIRNQVERRINEYRSETSNVIRDAAISSEGRDRIIDALESAENNQKMPAGWLDIVRQMVTGFDPDAEPETVKIEVKPYGHAVVWNGADGELESIDVADEFTIAKFTNRMVDVAKWGARAEGRTAMRNELRKLLNIE